MSQFESTRQNATHKEELWGHPAAQTRMGKDIITRENQVSQQVISEKIEQPNLAIHYLFRDALSNKIWDPRLGLGLVGLIASDIPWNRRRSTESQPKEITQSNLFNSGSKS